MKTCQGFHKNKSKVIIWKVTTETFNVIWINRKSSTTRGKNSEHHQRTHINTSHNSSSLPFPQFLLYHCFTGQGSINKREGETATLTCPSGRYITVSKASFGIGNRCGAPNAFTTVKDACQFQETCTIAASNTAIPGTTCTSGTQRLQISYICDQCKSFFLMWFNVIFDD